MPTKCRKLPDIRTDSLGNFARPKQKLSDNVLGLACFALSVPVVVQHRVACPQLVYHSLTLNGDDCIRGKLVGCWY